MLTQAGIQGIDAASRPDPFKPIRGALILRGVHRELLAAEKGVAFNSAIILTPIIIKGFTAPPHQETAGWSAGYMSTRLDELHKGVTATQTRKDAGSKRYDARD